MHAHTPKYGSTPPFILRELLFLILQIYRKIYKIHCNESQTVSIFLQSDQNKTVTTFL